MADSSRFFGWRIVLLGLIVNAIGAGLIGAYAFMVTPLIEEFGATPAQLGLGMSITIASMTLAAPVLGPIFDRGPLRSTMLCGVAVMLGALVLLSRAAALWQLAICLGLASMGIAMFGMLPAKVLIVNWFIRKRGRALALSYAGTSLASFAMPPTVAWLIELTSWRSAILWLAIGTAVLAAPAIAALAIRRPEDVGEHPDGDPVIVPVGDTPPPTPSLPLRSLTRNANFWLLGLGDAWAMSVPIGTAIFFIRHMEELGIARTDAAMVMPVMAAFSVAGKLSAGFLADHMDPKRLAVAALILHVTGLWIVALGSNLESMFLAAIPMGLGGGGFIPLPSILQARCFGRLVIGRVSGMHSLMGLPFMLVAAPAVGFTASATGSFVLPFLALGVVQLIAALVLACLRVPETEPDRGLTESPVAASTSLSSAASHSQ